MLEGYSLEVALTAANAAAQAWYGYDQGVVSGILISPDFIDTFPQTKVSNIQGITASCFSLGNLVGCLMAALAGNALGRKRTLGVGACVSAIGAILQFSATTYAQLMVGRIINGVGNGVLSSTCGIFQAESCRGSRRGKLSVIVIAHNVVFYCTANWITLACSFTSGGFQWRLPLALQLVPAIAMVGLLPLLPESPRWLLMHNRIHEGTEALRRHLGKGLLEDDPEVQKELRSIMAVIEVERQSEISFAAAISNKGRAGHLRRLLLGCGGQLMQQFTGINALNYYFPIILTENIGQTVLMARILAGCNAVSYTIASLSCFWMIENYGRRALMLSGSCLQFLSYVMVAIAVALLDKAPFQWGAVAITFLFFYYAVFGCTWGMVPWVYQAEVNALAMRTQAAAAATATNWLCNFVCSQFTPAGIQNLGYGFYILFACFNIIFFVTVFFLYPETANRTLEDLDAYFDKDSGHKVIIPLGDHIAKQVARPVEALEAEDRRIATTKALQPKPGGATTQHIEDSGV